MTTKATADWLEAAIVADLGVTCKKGFPAFDQPAIASGAYIEWANTTPDYGQRTGASLDVWQVQIALVVVTDSEIALWAMIDLMEAMAEERTEATISGKRTRVRFAPIERAENPNGLNALRYVAQTIIQFVR